MNNYVVDSSGEYNTVYSSMRDTSFIRIRSRFDRIYSFGTALAIF